MSMRIFSIVGFSLALTACENRPDNAVLAEAETVNFHPLVNTGTTAVSQADFRRFVAATGHGFEVVDFSVL